MKNKIVSIIIPAYNEEKYLPFCLESISALDYPKDDLEVIMVDNGSFDRTRAIAKSYGVKVLRDDSKNVSGLRNLGARHARGDILSFLDADCVVSDEWLRHASTYFDNQKVAAWGAPPIIPEEATWVQRAWFIVRSKSDPIGEVDWLESMNLFVRKDQFFDVGGFNDELVTCEDVDFCYKFSKIGKIVSDHRIEVVHLGEASTVKTFLKKEIWRGRSNLKGIKSHGLKLKELPSLLIPIYFGFFLPLAFLCVVFLMNAGWLLIPLSFYLIPSVAVIYKVRGKYKSLLDLFGLLFLLQVYFFSRTVAVIRSADR